MLREGRISIRALLEGGADVNAQTDYGVTTLHFASRSSHVDAVELLLKLGTDETMATDSGRTTMDVLE